MRVIRITAFAAVLPLMSVASAAAEAPGISLELGLGGTIAPHYEGSNSYEINPWPIVRLKRLTLPNGFQIGGGDGTGFSVKPSFRFMSDRTAADFPALTGLNNIDTAFELGAGVSYTANNWRVFGNLRRGVTGHDGFVGEIGADLITRPMQGLTVHAGPRASFADSEYMATYFGVTGPESVASGLAAFSPSGGFKSVGLEIGARYDFNADWAIEGTAEYARLIGDAGNSPVTALGSDDQFTIRLGLIRSFTVNF